MHIRLNAKDGGLLINYDLAQFDQNCTDSNVPLYPQPFVHPLPKGFRPKGVSEIRPYHTLIHLIEASKLQDYEFSWIFPFSSRIIIDIIKAIDPRITLEELALSIEQPIEKVCMMFHRF